MDKIFKGLQRFTGDVHNEKRDLFRSLGEGQNPEALFITCSDSRVVPNLITQTEPGDIFVLRNAGNIVPPFSLEEFSQAGTIEYAVSALKVPHIVVCGHAKCGAMGGVLNPESVASLPLVAKWLELADATRRIVEEGFSMLDPQEKLKAAVKTNVLVQIQNLKTHPGVASRLARGELQLHGWVYDFEHGEVEVYDAASGKFVHLDEAPAEHLNPPSALEGMAGAS